jgi:D-tagatose-1,6-bisphosphate aldolase subunit GatZ/KbaZ
VELRARLAGNKRGSGEGIYSVCSSHPAALDAAARQAKEEGALLLIESTSNQVDQNGGYTGMKPEDFAAFARTLCSKSGFPLERLLLGGDHLGPNVWQRENAAAAMEKAAVLVRAYVRAGYQKIHLDASMFCADDAGKREKPLADKIVAGRAAALCRVCEEEAAARPLEEKPLYVIGTEVPVPGGAKEAAVEARPSTPEGVRATLEISRAAFYQAGLEAAWERVIALVAQPGVEFGDSQISYYRREDAAPLSRALDGESQVFEAHSTDYQSERCLRELCEDHFCILKVGPQLTFAWREALFALEHIEAELIPREEERSGLSGVIERVMCEARPDWWRNYYRGSADELRFKRRFSLSDRVRYYWGAAEIESAVKKLFGNLERREIPFSLLSQYAPFEAARSGGGEAGRGPYEIAVAHIRRTLEVYARAVRGRCGGGTPAWGAA